MSLSDALAAPASSLARWWRAFIDIAARGPLGIALKLAVSAILIVIVCRKVDGYHIAARFSGQSVWWVIVAALVGLVQLLSIALRWGIILRGGLAVPAGWRTVLSATYISTFFNCWMLGTAGGDAVRAVLLPPGSAGRATVVYSVVFDRAATLAGLGVVVLPLVLFNLGPLAHSLPLFASLAVTAVPFIGFAAIALIVSRTRARRGPFFARLAQFVQVGRELLRSPGSCLAALAVSAASQVILSLMPYCLSRALHLDISLIDFLTLMPPVVLMVVLPISIGGWGVRESAMVAGLVPFGVAPDAALLISLEMGVLTALLSLPGGLIWLYRLLLRPLPAHAPAVAEQSSAGLR